MTQYALSPPAHCFGDKACNRWLVFCVALMATPSVAEANGLSDFTVRLSNGYEIASCNDIETVVSSPDGNGLFSPSDYPDVGPVQAYAVTESAIFLRACGLKDRPDGLWEVDKTRDFYFVIRTRDDAITGPMSATEFRQHHMVAGSDPNWEEFVNPIGTVLVVMFVSIIALPVGIVTAIFLFIEKRKERRDIKARLPTTATESRTTSNRQAAGKR